MADAAWTLVEARDAVGGVSGALEAERALRAAVDAEREVLAAAEERPVNPLAAVYLNRLSDLLFVLARAANPPGEEPLWRPGATR